MAAVETINVAAGCAVVAGATVVCAPAFGAGAACRLVAWADSAVPGASPCCVAVSSVFAATIFTETVFVETSPLDSRSRRATSLVEDVSELATWIAADPEASLCCVVDAALASVVCALSLGSLQPGLSPRACHSADRYYQCEPSRHPELALASAWSQRLRYYARGPRAILRPSRAVLGVEGQRVVEAGQ